MQDILAMILAGGMGNRLSILANERAKPAVPFGGRYRLIDFTLSNCVNSGIRRVGVVVQYAPRSLAQHLGEGRPWGLDYPAGKGFTLLQPYISRTSRDWYKGTADAILQNVRFIEEQKVKQVLVLGGDHVYTMRYDPMVAFHRHLGADITVGVVEVPADQASRFGIVELDHTGKVVAFEEKPVNPKGNLASMGIYVFNKDVLVHCLQEDASRQGSIHDFGKDVIPACMNDFKVAGFKFRGYWRDVGTVESYWQANMDLVVDLPPLNLYDAENEIRTASHSDAPVKLGPNASARRSLISNGSIINGHVWNSIISPHVFIEEGAVVSESIVFDDTHIGRDCIVHRAIVDKEVWLGRGSHIGWGDDYASNRDEPDNLNTGLTLVGKGAKVPPGTKIGRNCRIGCWVTDSDFPSNFISSGLSIDKRLGDPEANVDGDVP
ncbi:MAG: glucose-1-phosphate adenylyltransferase [Dehalococcoidia bacterium]|nr:glucose-1-phosphate adenylyltransferase [Dehalococcoidia bacterium]